MPDSKNITPTDLILDIVINRLPDLDKERDYTLEEMVTSECWNLLEKGEQILVGREFSNIVKRGLKTKVLPLEFRGKTSSNSNLYRKI